MKRLLKALSRVPTMIIPKGTYDLAQIDTLFRINHNMPDAILYGMACALGIFAFLRVSNVVSPSVHPFDKHHHLTREDVLVHKTEVRKKIRWAKNL